MTDFDKAWEYNLAGMAMRDALRLILARVCPDCTVGEEFPTVVLCDRHSAVLASLRDNLTPKGFEVSPSHSIISEPVRVHRRPGYQGAVLELGEGYFLPVREGMPVPGVHPGYVGIYVGGMAGGWSDTLDEAFEVLNDRLTTSAADVSERNAGEE